MYDTLNGNASVLEDALPSESSISHALRLVCYVVIFCTSLIGNTLVCLVVCRQQKLRTSTNFYIVNLACADLAITIFCIPFDIAVQENKYVWPFGDVLCRVLYPLMTMSAFASVGTLTAVALNRYIGISRPMKVRGAKKRAKFVMFVIWVTSFSAVLPYVLVLEVDSHTQCAETWPGPWSKAYTLFIFVFQYAIPLSIITGAYVTIGIQLRKNRAHLTAAHRRQDRDVTKVVRMMTIVVIIFAVCMLPNHIIWILREFTTVIPDESSSILHWGELLIYANSTSNPIVYSICIEEFRSAFRAYITKCCRVTEADIRPVNRMFERISFRGKSFSSDRFSRQAIRQANRYLEATNLGRREKVLRKTLSQTTFRESELPSQRSVHRMNSLSSIGMLRLPVKQPDITQNNGAQITQNNKPGEKPGRREYLQKLGAKSGLRITRV